MFNGIKRYFNRRALSDEAYAYLFEPYEGDEYVSFDCETTGLNPKKDEIITIGAVKIKSNRVLTKEKFEIKANPLCEVNRESIKIHHIRECDMQDGISTTEAVKRFIDFIGNRPLVGYYLEFDVAMINKTLKKIAGINLPNRCIEVSALYYDKKIELIPQGNIDLSFDKILKELKLPRLGQHSAINDAIMVALMYVKLQNIKSLRK